MFDELAVIRNPEPQNLPGVYTYADAILQPENRALIRNRLTEAEIGTWVKRGSVWRPEGPIDLSACQRILTPVITVATDETHVTVDDASEIVADPDTGDVFRWWDTSGAVELGDVMVTAKDGNDLTLASPGITGAAAGDYGWRVADMLPLTLGNSERHIRPKAGAFVTLSSGLVVENGNCGIAIISAGIAALYPTVNMDLTVTQPSPADGDRWGVGFGSSENSVIIAGQNRAAGSISALIWYGTLAAPSAGSNLTNSVGAISRVNLSVMARTATTREASATNVAATSPGRSYRIESAAGQLPSSVLNFYVGIFAASAQVRTTITSLSFSTGG